MKLQSSPEQLASLGPRYPHRPKNLARCGLSRLRREAITVIVTTATFCPTLTIVDGPPLGPMPRLAHGTVRCDSFGLWSPILTYWGRSEALAVHRSEIF